MPGDLRNPAPAGHSPADQTGSLQWPLHEVVAELHAARNDWRAAQHREAEPGSRELPSREVLTTVTHDLRGALFPLRLGPADLPPASEDSFVGFTLDRALNILLGQVRLELRFTRRHEAAEGPALEVRAREIVREFALQLPGIRRQLDRDVEAAYAGDPAARSVDEILLCYPGIEAVIHHRMAHQLYRLGVPLLARMVAEIAHSDTGIDIHPGARIGTGFFIDHGTGVVIGETAVIGERVRIYQNVTLGAKRFDTDASGALAKGQPRHPIIEDQVVIYAGATLLGRITVGRGSAIGGNVWLTHSVQAGSVVTQASIRHETAAGEKS
jgi:serine O-acetyltransferase